jgi:hypothetical protein
LAGILALNIIKKVTRTNMVMGITGEVDIRLTNMVKIANNTLKYSFTFLMPLE